MRPKLVELARWIDEEIKKFKKFARQTEESANDIARTSYNSPSQSGDREHSRGQAIIVAQNLLRFEKLKEEIVGFLNKEKPKVVEPICFVTVDWEGGEKGEFYFVQNPVFITGLKFVSSSSALGRDMLGKKEGETFKFKLENSSKTGKVISIE
jgi:transcription elongation GreA/GreB family factor